MTHEVVVVGAGIGGLTVAALLAARGLDVCLCERDSKVGGCAQNFEKFGYSFESGTGLYTGWRAGEIHDRVFDELKVSPPEVFPLNPAFIIRLPDRSEVALTADEGQFEENLRNVFPECSEQAVEFYHSLAETSRVPDVFVLRTSGMFHKLRSLLPRHDRSRKLETEFLHPHLAGLSFRFRRFLDVQLNVLAQASTADCSYSYAASILNSARSMFSIRGGGSALAEVLAASIRKSGGKIRLDTPVLRLTPDSPDKATGVDLLSGETVGATKAVISNLTVWDTYGKLLGLSRASNEVRRKLDSLNGQGAYVIYAGMEEAAAQRLPASRILTLSDWQQEESYDPALNQLAFSTTASDDSRAPAGKRAVTIYSATDVNDWFAFHEDESEHEEQDQRTLESCWERLHSAIPELGGDIEVIDTATPRTFYEQTRRKLGMVGSVASMAHPVVSEVLGPHTLVPNLYRVGDTTLPGGGLAGVANSALAVANLLTS